MNELDTAHIKCSSCGKEPKPVDEGGVLFAGQYDPKANKVLCHECYLKTRFTGTLRLNFSKAKKEDIQNEK